MEEIRTAFSGIALVMSLIALWVSRHFWLQSNRPIVSAAIETFVGGSESIAYNLAVINSGNRPAVGVQLTADPAEIEKCLMEWTQSFRGSATTYEGIMRCFGADGEIPLLLDGKTVTNSFGYTGNTDGTSSFWKYGSSFSVLLTYADLEGRKYSSKVRLVIKDSASFAGGLWSKGDDF